MSFKNAVANIEINELTKEDIEFLAEDCKLTMGEVYEVLKELE